MMTATGVPGTQGADAGELIVQGYPELEARAYYHGMILPSTQEVDLEASLIYKANSKPARTK